MVRSLLDGHRGRRALKAEGGAGTKTQWCDSVTCFCKARGHVRLEWRVRWNRTGWVGGGG